MPILDNMHAVQAGIQQVVDAIADDRIDNRRAGLLLYALQQAASGLRSTPEWKGQRPEIAPEEPLRALEIQSLQNQFALPFDTDLDGPPDLAAAQIDATIALPLDARPSQTQQPSLARVPARDSQGAPEPALSLSKGSPIVWANPARYRTRPRPYVNRRLQRARLPPTPRQMPPRDRKWTRIYFRMRILPATHLL